MVILQMHASSACGFPARLAGGVPPRESCPFPRTHQQHFCLNPPTCPFRTSRALLAMHGTSLARPPPPSLATPPNRSPLVLFFCPCSPSLPQRGSTARGTIPLPLGLTDCVQPGAWHSTVADKFQMAATRDFLCFVSRKTTNRHKNGALTKP